MGDKIGKWEKLLQQALEKEEFGQLEEAMEDYETLSKQLNQELSNGAAELLTPQRRTAITKLSAVFHGRQMKLKHDLDATIGKARGEYQGRVVSVKDIETLKPNFRKLFASEEPFPIDTTGLKGPPAPKPSAPAGPALASAPGEDDSPVADKGANQGTLKPCPPLKSGKDFIKFTIDSIGLKDAQMYIEPHMLISVRDKEGKELVGEESQQTPTATGTRKETNLPFNQAVYIQTPLNELPADAAIFFEFRHYKPKKKMISVRCWAWIAVSEIEEGTIPLQILAKPADYRRNKVFKHSKKPLYLHTTIQFIRG